MTSQKIFFSEISSWTLFPINTQMSQMTIGLNATGALVGGVIPYMITACAGKFPHDFQAEPDITVMSMQRRHNFETAGREGSCKSHGVRAATQITPFMSRNDAMNGLR